MIVPYREECRQLQSSMPTTRILSFCMDAGLLRFNCRKIVSSLTGIPSRCIKYSRRRPPMLWPIKPTISSILAVLFGARRVQQWATGLRRFAAGMSGVCTAIQCELKFSRLGPELASPGGRGCASRAGNGFAFHNPGRLRLVSQRRKQPNFLHLEA